MVVVGIDIMNAAAPTKAKFVAYLRVSTARQGRSGLGLEAQRESVQRFVAGRGGRIMAPEFIEVESGKRNDRPELHKAIKRCRLTAATLVVAKLDRLSRNAAFLMTLRDSDVQFVAADLPEANTMTVGVMAVVAQHEREAISARTKAALAAAKARGKKLGGRRPGAGNIARYQRQGVEAAQEKAQERLSLVADDLRRLHGEGLSLNAMAARLNADGIQTSRGGRWTATAVKRALAGLDA
jgi:DNA invertase Pin-like site-specific DNA recombinase